MTKEQLVLNLNSGRLSKSRIDSLVQSLLNHHELVQPLLIEVFRQDKNDEFNASWVFDHLMRKKLGLLLPHLELFTLEIKQLTSESCIRPIAHTCQLLAEAYFKKKNQEVIESMTSTQLERLVDCCFDWLIEEHKIASKVFAMTTLFYLGKRFEWIHPELKIILEKNIGSGTSGYRNRGKKTLDMLVALGH